MKSVDCVAQTVTTTHNVNNNQVNVMIQLLKLTVLKSSQMQCTIMKREQQIHNTNR